MGKFDGVLLASDFDNTLLYTEESLRSCRPCRRKTGGPWPTSSPRGAALPSPQVGPFRPSFSTRGMCL